MDGVSNMIDDTAVKISKFCNDHDVHMEVTYLSTWVIYEMSKKTPSGCTCKRSATISTTDLIANDRYDIGYILDNLLTELEEYIKKMEDTNDNT